MKLFIINGEDNDDKKEININEYSMVRDIRFKFDEILHGNGSFTKEDFKLIYKNIILFDNNSIKFYKFCENDQIWFGSIEKYLRKDDFIIVEVFIWVDIFGDECLIVKINDTISTIKSVIERIYSEVINIWNADGKQMKMDQFVSDINTNKIYKLIINCVGEGNKINNTFNDCIYWHDRDLVDFYLTNDRIRDSNKIKTTGSIIVVRMIKIRRILLSNDTIDDRLNQNLSDLPSSFLDSTNFFCDEMMYRIVDICNDYWSSVINQYEDDVVKIYNQYFPFAIKAALWDFANIRQQNNNKINKSVKDIIIDAFDYFVKYWIDSNNDWRYWLRLFMDQYLLGSFSDSDLNERIDEFEINKFAIKMRINGEDTNNFIAFKPETIIEAKQTISSRHKVDMKHLYCINPGGDHKPDDEDKFNDDFIIEIVMNMNDIKILRLLGQGAFSATFVCLNQISNRTFVLKKGIQTGGDLCRDINIYSKLNSSRNIMNYSGLFRYKENICIGMEYMSGGSLSSYLNKGKHFSEQEIVKFSFEILTQINELHKLGIIHRDIKSDNIVIDRHNHAKLIDFGMSKYTFGLTSKYLLDKLKAYKPGTICYMAPELIKEEPYSEKIDIWSFGMVMVEMVTDKRPFHGMALYQIIKNIRDCIKYEFAPVFPISNELNNLINLCLNTNPDYRPSVEKLIKSELFVDYLNTI